MFTVNPATFYLQAASIVILWNGRVSERRDDGEGSLQVVLKKKVRPASKATVRDSFPLLCPHGDCDQVFDMKKYLAARSILSLHLKMTRIS